MHVPFTFDSGPALLFHDIEVGNAHVYGEIPYGERIRLGRQDLKVRGRAVAA